MQPNQYQPEQPQLVLRPSTNFWFMAIKSLKTIAITLIVIIIAAGGGDLISSLFNSGPGIFIGILLGALVVSIVIGSGITYLTLSNTKYNFYKDRVEYYEGFWNQNKYSVMYNRITNLGQTNSIYERIFGLGTIHISTGAGNTGALIKHVKNPDATYNKLQSIVQNTRPVQQ
ncbi:MAG: PH domain-containing protein [Nanobdellota archaeon]